MMAEVIKVLNEVALRAGHFLKTTANITPERKRKRLAYTFSLK